MGKKQTPKRSRSKKTFGRGANECRRCGRKQGLIRRYDIYLCRQCFREVASEMGFKKYR
ncbi:MAG: 30S ribosomal protein S14 [Candidatus Methanolliviera hydrocarbonicum]|uniref:Small ribosomal subunit protein uS14 n=1 Tax=Candidatus Methanolliviera hydrocarbonicum TaxID=2491085 RepID=A0A520KYM8_9EURY|nr:MAG: 30S ribosomal protein S14 [Candidatus Methanolliviera hydrocarbonicum]